MPAGAYATANEGALRMRGVLLSLDGTLCLAAERDGRADHGAALGRDAADELLEKGGAEIIRALRSGEG